MDNQAPSLWDNMDLLLGTEQLERLEWNQALRHLIAAKRSSIDPEDSQQTIAAAEYWKPRITKIQKEGKQAEIGIFLNDFSEYPFPSRLFGFKKALLGFFGDQLMKDCETEFETIRLLFDLLLSIQIYEKATVLVSFFLEQYPENLELKYQLAQAQWLKGEKGKARKSYIIALLNTSDTGYMDRIEIPDLKKVITQWGFVLAPGYGWIQGFLPLYPQMDEITAWDDAHQKALNGYLHLQKAHRSLEKKDPQSAIFHRQKLQEAAPELYNAYFEMLKKREK